MARKPTGRDGQLCASYDFARPFPGAMPLREVTLAHAQEFIKALLGKGLLPKTIGNVIGILEEMFKHTVQWGHPDSDPVGATSARRSVA